MRDWKKKLNVTHTLDSASILPCAPELDDEALENVIGGMSTHQFEDWRVKKLNEYLQE
jgi:hypothetical protein